MGGLPANGGGVHENGTSPKRINALATIAMDIECLDAALAQPIIAQCERVGRMLTRLMAAMEARG